MLLKMNISHFNVKKKNPIQANILSNDQIETHSNQFTTIQKTKSGLCNKTLKLPPPPQTQTRTKPKSKTKTKPILKDQNRITFGYQVTCSNLTTRRIQIQLNRLGRILRRGWQGSIFISLSLSSSSRCCRRWSFLGLSSLLFGHKRVECFINKGKCFPFYKERKTLSCGLKFDRKVKELILFWLTFQIVIKH